MKKITTDQLKVAGKFLVSLAVPVGMGVLTTIGAIEEKKRAKKIEDLSKQLDSLTNK